MAAYADVSDLAVYALPSTALSEASTGDKTSFLEEASRMADSFFCARYVVPLTAWGVDLRAQVCRVAAYLLLTRNGFDTADEGSSYRRQHDQAMRHWERIGEGKAHITGGATVPTAIPSLRVATASPRGFSASSSSSRRTCDDD
jgi:phage gp36-like protein